MSQLMTNKVPTKWVEKLIQWQRKDFRMVMVGVITMIAVKYNIDVRGGDMLSDSVLALL